MCLHLTHVCFVSFFLYVGEISLSSVSEVAVSLSQTCYFFCTQNIRGCCTLLALEHAPTVAFCPHRSTGAGVLHTVDEQLRGLTCCSRGLLP